MKHVLWARALTGQNSLATEKDLLSSQTEQFRPHFPRVPFAFVGGFHDDAGFGGC